MEVKISPSIMCCHIEEYKPYIELFEKVGLDSIHFDIMDGHYVKNVMLGTPIYKDIKRLTNLPIDIHIMSDEPELFLEYYDVQPNDRVSFHPETSSQPYKLLQTIKEKGCLAGLVINPGTPLTYLEECIDEVDYVTLMTVNPGFAGQMMVKTAPKKIKKTRELLNKYKKDIDIVVDGNTTIENSKLMKEAGANVFVVGTSSIITGLSHFEKNYKEYYEELRK